MDIQSIKYSIEYQMLRSEVSSKAETILSLFEDLDPSKARLSLQVNGPGRATIVVQSFRDPQNAKQNAEFWKKVRETAEKNEIPYRLSDDNPPVVVFDISLDG